MKLQLFNKITSKIIDNDLSFNLLNEDEKEFLRNNPYLLKKLTNITFIKKRYLYMLFTFSLALAIFAKTVEYTKFFDQSPIIQDITANVGLSISMEILGATLVAFIMEIILERKVRENEILIKQILQNKTSK